MKPQLMIYLEARTSALWRTSRSGRVLLPMLMLAAIFGLDLHLPAAASISVLYVIPIVLTLALGQPRATYMVFVPSSVATVAAAAFGMPQGETTEALVTRGLALVAQVLVAAVIIRQLELRDELAAAKLRLAEATSLGKELAADRRSRATAAEAMLEALPTGFFLLDRRGVVRQINAACLRLLGLEREQALGRHWQELGSVLGLCHADGRPISAEDLLGSELVFGEEQARLELIVRPMGDRRSLHLTVSLAPLDLAEERGRSLMVVVQDVTALRAAERQKDEFVSMATHELRTPMSTLRGYVQLAQKLAAQAEAHDVVAPMGKALRQVDRLNRLVGELLDVSRVHAGQMELQQAVTDLATLVRDAVEQQRAASPLRTIELFCEGSLPDLLADTARLEQVLANLLDNAIKYSPAGGPVIVRAWREEQEVLVTVTDQGVGIPKGEQEGLFRRFYRAGSGAQRFSGLGVGLYISQTIVALHGGRMWVESEPGHGSTFGFALPMLKTSETACKQRAG